MFKEPNDSIVSNLEAMNTDDLLRFIAILLLDIKEEIVSIDKILRNMD